MLLHIAGEANYTVELIYYLSLINSAVKAFCVVLVVKRFFWKLASRSERLKKAQQWVSHVDTATLFMLAVLPFTPTSFLHLAFGISDFDEKRYLLTLLAGKAVMVAMMALFGQSLVSALKNPVYLILALAIWAGMYWVSRKFCKKHDLDR